MTKRIETITIDDDEILDEILEKDFEARYGIPKPVDENNPTHYVNNKKLAEVLVDYKKKCDGIPKGEPLPRLPEYVGHCFLLIAKKLAMRPNFIQYTYRDEMIGDAVENCIVYAHNFDPTMYSVKLRQGKTAIGRARIHIDYIEQPYDVILKNAVKIKMQDGYSIQDVDNVCDITLNPFGYFTQYIWNAFVRRIEIEETQRYKVAKEIQRTGIVSSSFSVQDHDMDEEFHNSLLEFLQENDNTIREYEEKLVKKKEKQKAKAEQKTQSSPKLKKIKREVPSE